MSLPAAIQRMIFEAVDGVALPGRPDGVRLYDMAPPDAAFPFASFGPFDAVDDGAQDLEAQQITVQMDVWTSDQGRLAPCRVLVGQLRALLHEATGTLEDGALVQMRVEQTRTKLDPDGVTGHGVLVVTADVEA